jgi:hypothetical protein
MVKDIAAHHVAQNIRLPPAAAQDCLLTPGTGIARRFRSHPAGLATLITSRPSGNNPAEAATRPWQNKERIRAFTSRSDDAKSSSVSSIDAPIHHDLHVMGAHRFNDR